MMDKNEIINNFRYFLKDKIRQEINFSLTDQNRGIAPPPIEKPFSSDATVYPLTKPDEWTNIKPIDLKHAISNRKSRRVYKNQAMTLEELSFLLWATQGLRNKPIGDHAYRNVPSAGCRHCFETYIAVLQVDQLVPGIYRYLPISHHLLFEFADENLSQKLIKASLGQSFVGKGALTFIWAAIPYRMEWRYDLSAHKVIAMDAGHVCQNLYLACEAINAGTCAIAAYHQELMDEMLRLDGKDEYTIYLAPVGKITLSDDLN